MEEYKLQKVLNIIYNVIKFIKGVWVAPYIKGESNLLLFDVEGSDSVDRWNDKDVILHILL